MAVGAFGLVLETHNGGQSWNHRTIGQGDTFLYAITQGPDGTVYIAGEFGSVFQSKDQGKSWRRLPIPYEGTLFGILAPSNGTLLIFGIRGNLYRSEDEGLTWHKIETPKTASLLGGAEIQPCTIVLVGLRGTTLVSNDGGRTFWGMTRTNPKGVENRKGIAAVALVGNTSLVAVGEAGVGRITIPSHCDLIKNKGL